MTIFTMKIALVKIIFGCKIFICEPIFKIFAAILKTFGMKKRCHYSICKRVFKKKAI